MLQNLREDSVCTYPSVRQADPSPGGSLCLSYIRELGDGSPRDLKVSVALPFVSWSPASSSETKMALLGSRGTLSQIRMITLNLVPW